jgi:hypothetical protein
VTDVAFRVLCAQDRSDHATIVRFRAEHEDTFAAVFTQVLLLVAAESGLARLGTVAIDGTKIRSTLTPVGYLSQGCDDLRGGGGGQIVQER